MKNLKFKVYSPDHSEAIQKRLFELGYRWGSDGCIVSCTDRFFLYADSEGYITHCNDDYEFEIHKNKEVTINDLYDPVFMDSKYEINLLINKAKRKIDNDFEKSLSDLMNKIVSAIDQQFKDNINTK